MSLFVTRIISIFKTWTLFVLTLAVLFVFVLLYPVVKLGRKLWLRCLQSFYPNVEFSESNTIRSVVDTARNPGIIHFLLKLDGECDIEVIRHKFRDHLLSKPSPSGDLLYPKLQSKLNLCWGYYVWSECDDFDLANHIFCSPNLYRGRPINESNIQAHLSDTISKYLPPQQPPWQVILTQIVRQNETMTYVLVRLHHLLLVDQPHLKISDFLLVDTTSRLPDSEPQCAINRRSPFNCVLPDLVSIPELKSRILCYLANNWNEFKYDFFVQNSKAKEVEDPIVLVKLLVIVSVTVAQKFIRNYPAIDQGKRGKYLWNLTFKELEGNNLNRLVLMGCLKNLGQIFSPLAFIRYILSQMYIITNWIVLYWPRTIINETRSVVNYIFNKEFESGSLIGFLSLYIPLLGNCIQELGYYVSLIITGPRQLLHQIFNSQDDNHHALQMASICGRKVIGWSEKIKLNHIHELNTGLERYDKDLIDTELMLTWLAASIKDCLTDHEAEVPESIEISARCFDQNCFLGRMHRLRGIDGIFCLSLPLGDGDRSHLKKIRRYLKDSREKNVTLYTLTKNESRQNILTEMLSTPWVRLLTNYLSKKFCITITDIVGSCESKKYRTLYGKNVLEFDYFRPPMANTSLSITLQRYNDYIRLAVVADAVLAPNHQKIINEIINYAHKFRKE